MGIKDRIERMLGAIEETDPSQEAKRNMISRLNKSCVNYIDITLTV